MSYNALHLSFEGGKRRFEVSGEEFITFGLFVKAAVGTLEGVRSALGNGLEEVGAFSIDTIL